MSKPGGESAIVKAAAGVLCSTLAATSMAFRPFSVFTQKGRKLRESKTTRYARRQTKGDSLSAWLKNPYPWEKSSYSHSPFSALALIEKSNTMAELFAMASATYGEEPCIGERPLLNIIEEEQADGKTIKKMELGDYQWYSYKILNKMIDVYGRALRDIGVRPRENVVLLAETRPEWMIMAQTLISNNMPVVTLYANLSDEGVIHGINETEATVLITTRDQLEKLRSVMSRMPSLSHIIYMESRNSLYTEKPAVISGKLQLSMADLRKIGEEASDDGVEDPPRREDTAILMYTSGSTGVPKAVTLTHGNLLASTKAMASVFESVKVNSCDVYLAYLPLAHVLEMIGEVLSLLYGVRIGYSSPLTMTDKSSGIIAGKSGDATLLRPTIMPAVPLVLDRVRKAIFEAASEKSAFSRRFLELAVDYKIKMMDSGMQTSVFDTLIFDKIKNFLGGRMRFIAVGSAPLSPETQSFIRAALGCVVVQGYGLTETCAAATAQDSGDPTTGSVGAPVRGAYIKLVDWLEGGYRAADGRGEIVIGGDMISTGYYKNEKLTKEQFVQQDGRRWFYTGDIGEINRQGTIKIIDRKKDLVKLQHGEYVSLGKIETELKTMALIDNMCVVASSAHTYLVAVVTPNAKVLGALLPNKSQMSFEDQCNDKQLCKTVQEAMAAHVKALKFLKVEIPQKVKLSPIEWVPDTGLVTAAFKIRRKQIQDFYQEDIDRLYSDN